MYKQSCFYCNKGEKLESLMIHICELSGSHLYLNLNQSHLGRVIVVSKVHEKEVFELSTEEREDFMQDVSLVSKVIQSIFSPDKINYAIFGDIVNHFHMHIVPKYQDKRSWGLPYSDQNPVLLNREQYIKLINEINAAIRME